MGLREISSAPLHMANSMSRCNIPRTWDLLLGDKCELAQPQFYRSWLHFANWLSPHFGRMWLRSQERYIRAVE